MVLSTSSTLGGKAASTETLRAAIEACRIVLHEVHRRVDATVTNAAIKNELRQGLRLAESALNNASKAATRRTANASYAAPPPPSNSEAHSGANDHGGRSSSTDHAQGCRNGSIPHIPQSRQGVSSDCPPASNAPPLPVKDDRVARPTVPPPTLLNGQQYESVLGEGEEARAEKRIANTSLGGASDSTKGEPGSPVTGKMQLNMAETYFPLCSPPQTAAVYSFVLSAVFWRRRKLTEYALTAIEALLRAVSIPQHLSTTLIVDPTRLNGDGGGGGHGAAGDRRGCRGNGVAGAGYRRMGRISVAIGAAVYYALDECLTQSFSEPAVQTRALRLLNALVEGSTVQAAATDTTRSAGTNGSTGVVFFHPDGAVEDVFHSQAAIRTIEASYAVAVNGAQETVRHRARLLLCTAVRHVVRAFVTMQVPDESMPESGDLNEPQAVFATDTLLTDYKVDVDHNDPFTPIRIVPWSKASNAALPNAQCTGGPPSVGSVEGHNNNSSNVSTFTRPQVEGGEGAGSEQQKNDGNNCPIAGDVPTAAPMPLGTASAPSHQFGIGTGDANGADRDACAQRGKPSTLPSTSQNAGPASGTLAAQPIQLNSDSFAHGGHSGSSSQSTNLTFNPHQFFCSSIDDSLVTDALSTLNDMDGALPSSLKDLLMLLRRMCHCAVRPCSGALSDSNLDIRARDVSLWVLELTFEGFPVANCGQEHRCAVWMSLVMHACKYELLGCLSRNLAMPAPFSFFERALHLLEMMLCKLHHHLARELHTLLGAFLLPLMSSKYAGFRQKHAVLAMIRQLFSVPHLCVSFFVNYDCNPAFDADAEYGGMLELLVEHVAETIFLDHVNEDGDAYPWLTSDQQQLLRSECVVVIHTFMNSMHRWIAEDPQEYATALRRSVQKAIQRRDQQQQGADNGVDDLSAAVDEVAELYLDNWEAEEGTCPELTLAGSCANGDMRGEAIGASSTECSTGVLHTHNLTVVLDAASNLAVSYWGKKRNIKYHWKHIHYLLHNKRIAQEAVQLINSGKWQDAKVFLENRGYIAAIPPSEDEIIDPTTVPPGDSSYRLFARFLFDYPGISRDSLSKIFERVNRKDGAARLILTEYLRCFNYADVPIDVAMRDTTCKFMSWDRPMFESKVWETIQKCFGAEYARQNPYSITVNDADTMAGVLLFLHSNLHNQIVKNNRMPASEFVRDANDCLSYPLAAEDLQAMYHRVLHSKWELDTYGRTPQQAERERTLVRLSAKIQMGHAAKVRRRSAKVNNSNTDNNNSITNNSVNVHSNSVSASGITQSASLQGVHSALSKDPGAEVDTALLDEALQGTETESVSCHSSSTACCSPVFATVPAVQSTNVSMDASPPPMWVSKDVVLLDNTIPSYTDCKDTMKFKDEQHQAFLEASAIYLSRLESVHRLYCIEGDAYRPQPYIVPYYAEHVRQMFLMTYPHVMSCVYMGFRVLEEAPISLQLLDTLQLTYDIAAAFVLNLRDLRPVMEEAIQRYLDDERAYKLLPLSRATFVPFMLNIL
ncbi:hypothetical protein ABL78_0754 [Leptomonas seymouri]|uniref:SEC7 domain-containing protein n=1 Tax=Leptomonas seymouri TaxID=5684 RepID=A0A0N0P8M3_LEPSE|nr:hypothetical protein ABL78_0754 [Leptomonas seymouri]|eukprot:KPI90109.1 hypothetical protein ABL78_0754 [Leptomonas seymouri]